MSPYFSLVLSTDHEPEQDGEGEVINVTLNKGVTGLGFLIQGGKSTPKGDLPLTIKRIFKGRIVREIKIVYSETPLDWNPSRLEPLWTGTPLDWNPSRPKFPLNQTWHVVPNLLIPL